MTPVFLDTSYFLALLIHADEFHEQACRFSRTNHRPLVTTGAVLVELGARFCRADERATFLSIVAALRQNTVTVIYNDEDLIHRAIARFSQRADKDWSLADCISFVVMDDQHIKEAATTDKHFEEAGFVALLRQSLKA